MAGVPASAGLRAGPQHRVSHEALQAEMCLPHQAWEASDFVSRIRLGIEEDTSFLRLHVGSWGPGLPLSPSGLGVLQGDLPHSAGP